MVDNSLPWDMAVQQGEELPQIVRVAMEEESLKKDIIQKGQSFADRMKMILGVFPSKKWTLEEGECQIDVLPDGTYRFEFPHGPNPSRCAWLQIGSDIVEGWFPFDTLANSVLFRTDSNEPLMAQKIKIDEVLKTAESILGKIEALQQMGTDAVVIDTAHQVDNALEA